jgi:hypothetical protein
LGPVYLEVDRDVDWSWEHFFKDDVTDFDESFLDWQEVFFSHVPGAVDSNLIEDDDRSYFLFHVFVI